MRNLIISTLGASAILGGAMLVPGPVKADDVEINVRSDVSVRAQLKFYSKDRPYVWPSATTAWNLNDYETHAYNLACISGEKICFGAWSVPTGRLYWGVGHGGANSCRNCCFICGEGPYRTQGLDE
jgi:hypothetical protein